VFFAISYHQTAFDVRGKLYPIESHCTMFIPVSKHIFLKKTILLTVFPPGDGRLAEMAGLNKTPRNRIFAQLGQVIGILISHGQQQNSRLDELFHRKIYIAPIPAIRHRLTEAIDHLGFAHQVAEQKRTPSELVFWAVKSMQLFFSQVICRSCCTHIWGLSYLRIPTLIY
jgi:hypothetical protein